MPQKVVHMAFYRTARNVLLVFNGEFIYQNPILPRSLVALVKSFLSTTLIEIAVITS